LALHTEYNLWKLHCWLWESYKTFQYAVWTNCKVSCVKPCGTKLKHWTLKG